ncbi:flagellar filament capping protein FliD [Helicobacter sp. 23-1045]
MNPLSSLGVGSGVLNYDIIDKLKKADENAQVAPIDRKLQQNLTKQTELAALKGMLGALHSNARKISDYSTYLGRNATSSDESKLKVSANAGVPPQNLTIKIDEIAKNSVNEIGKKFSSREDNFAGFDTSLNFRVGGKDYSIAISANESLEMVAQKIIDETDGAVNASIMKTGSGAESYSLMINSKGSGAESNIFFGTNLESKEINSIDFKNGDFNLTLITSSGAHKTLNISAEGNLSALKSAILDALSNDLEFADLVKNGNISVSISGDGKKILLNDNRGFEISVGGEKAGEIFTDFIANEKDTLIAKKTITGGKISGEITIGGESIDFGKITGTSAESNKEAILEAINNIEGYSAKITKEGFLAINSATGEVSIKAPKDSEALKALGINVGTYKDFGVANIGIKNIQKASDARFSYNGVQMTRPSNVVDDIVSGVTLELFGESENNISVSISQNTQMILDEIKAFAESYNMLIPKLEELTRYDEDTKIAGVFNGNSDIRSIKSNLRRALGMTYFENGKNVSLANFGISFNDDGRMLIDESKLRSELSTDAESAMSFFRESKVMIAGKEESRKGVFTLVERELDALVGLGDSRLKLFEENLTNDDKRLKDERKRNLELLNSRYETMANRFAAYDSQIAKTNNASNHLNMLIEQSIADKRK